MDFNGTLMREKKILVKMASFRTPNGNSAKEISKNDQTNKNNIEVKLNPCVKKVWWEKGKRIQN